MWPVYAFAAEGATRVADSAPEGLRAYLVAFWGSFEMQIMIGLLVTGLVGIFANWIYKWSTKQIEGNLFTYLFVTNPQKTLYSYIAYIGAAIAAMTAGIFFGSQGGFVGWKAVLWFGLTTGFSIDTIINKGQTKIWTARQRATERKRLAEKKKPKRDIVAEANLKAAKHRIYSAQRRRNESRARVGRRARNGGRDATTLN